MNPTPKNAVKGRGAIDNLPNRFESMAPSQIPEWEQEWEGEEEIARPKTLVYKDLTKSIVTTNDSPDIGFEASINPYRGCEHGCIYCYARPTHEYLGLSSGLDFETKIFVKEQAPELLRKTLASESWTPKTIVMSGVTDCYQPIERSYELTRKCLEVLAEFRNPTFLITKNFLVTRDIDYLKELAKYSAAGVLISITTLDNELCAKMEPRTSRPEKRLEAIRHLAEAGIPVGVNVAPVIPGLTDFEVPRILEAAKKAGASFAGYTMLRLPYGVKDLFADWLKEHFPDKEKKIWNRVEDIREGKRNDSSFGSRMSGTGVFAAQLKTFFNISRRRLGLQERGPHLSTKDFNRSHDSKGQLSLFR